MGELVATWLFRNKVLFMCVTFAAVFFMAIQSHQTLAIVWLVIGFPITFVVTVAVVGSASRLLVGGWSRDQATIDAWLATIPRPRPPRR